MDVQVKISKRVPTKGFRKAVVIVVAIEKMRMSSKAKVFTDDDLLNILNAVLGTVSHTEFSARVGGMREGGK